ncbi:MAG: hypothetical protein IJU37_01540 [Desulfovibrio sp.]|nr:hypothetical protein [Desulfovibrio sp.]
MRTVFRHPFVVLCGFLLCVTLGLPCHADQPLKQSAEWTVMVYMGADNNLEFPALMDLLEMEQAIPEDVEIIVLVDRHRGYTDILGNWTGARLYRVRRAAPFAIGAAADLKPGAHLPSGLASELLEDWGEVDMADPATLTRFITTAAARFPARRYALLPWNHGGGWPGLILDEDGGNGRPGKGMMTVGQFVAAAKMGATALPRRRFDLLKYDMCLMGQLDVMAATAPVADYAYASPPVEPTQSSDYLSVLPLFREGVSTEELARDMVDINVRYFTRVGRPAAFAAYDLARMGEVTQALRGLTEGLRGLAGTRFKELTRVTCFATHYEDLMEDLKRGAKATSSVVLEDWLERLEREVPDASAKDILRLREAVSRLVYHAGATPDMQTSKGVTLYIPLRREYENPAYRSTAFARESGMADYLAALYTAQETLGNAAPRVTNVQLGSPRLKPGRDGRSDGDFDIVALNHLTPFARNVVRFDVTGVGILMTRLLQFEQRGAERYLNYVQLVADSERSDVRKDSGNLLNDISPTYNDGTTTLMREVGVKYKVTNGQSLENITIINTSASRDVDKNVSVGFGLYRDPTTGGQDVLVQVNFSNLLRMPIKVMAYLPDARGRITAARGIDLRSDGVFRPAVSVLDENYKERRVFGSPMPLSGGTLLLAIDMMDEGTQVGYIIQAQTMNGKRANAVGPTLPVRRDPKQVALRDNALRNGGANLAGRYVMVQYAAGNTEVDALPTFQTITFTPGQPLPRWELRDGDKLKGSGPMIWLDAAVPQITVYKESVMPLLPVGETVQTWYAFLKGQGSGRVWYCIGMPDGTRWAFVPLEQYKGGMLDGVWTSKTERWQFSGHTVQLTRDGHTGRGTFRMDGHVLQAIGMPFNEYAVYLDQEHGRLTLMSREGVASILTREGEPTAPLVVVPAGQQLVGNWGSGHARMSIMPVPGTPFFNLWLHVEGQGAIVCTFAVSGDALLATFGDGYRERIPYVLKGSELQLQSQRLPVQRFIRQ